MNKQLWLTYAWSDNQTADVDYVIQEIKTQGIDVRFDRQDLRAGQRFWPQIDQHIAKSSSCDAWAIYTTKASLESEPCREELAYALLRALSFRGSDFPLIAILPEPVDSDYLPGALKSRLYVNLQDADWLSRVKSGVDGSNHVLSRQHVLPYRAIWHRNRTALMKGTGYILEVRPRAGRWLPTWLSIPLRQRDSYCCMMIGPKDFPTLEGIVRSGEYEDDARGRFIISTSTRVDNLNSLYVGFKYLPFILQLGSGDRDYDLPVGVDVP